MTLLADLPTDHPLRNTPLLQVKAQFKRKEHKNWKDVTPNMNISKVTYNSLGSVWTDYDEWRANEANT